MIHQRLKQIRVKNGFTQQEVAEHLHMTQNTISKIESGFQKIDIELFVKLAAYYKVAPQQLLNNDFVKPIEHGENTTTPYLDFNKAILTLSEQLKEKDRQIEVLMSIIKNK